MKKVSSDKKIKNGRKHYRSWNYDAYFSFFFANDQFLMSLSENSVVHLLAYIVFFLDNTPEEVSKVKSAAPPGCEHPNQWPSPLHHELIRYTVFFFSCVDRQKHMTDVCGFKSSSRSMAGKWRLIIVALSIWKFATCNVYCIPYG